MNTVDNENDKRPIRDCRQKKKKDKSSSIEATATKLNWRLMKLFAGIS